MKRFLGILMIVVLLTASVTAGFAVPSEPTPFEAGDQIELKATGSSSEPAAYISFNVPGSYDNSGINFDFILTIPYDMDPLVVTIEGYGTSEVDYELGSDPYTGNPEPVYVIEIPRSVGPMGGYEEIDLDVKWFPASANSQEVMHGTISVMWEPVPLFSVTTSALPPEGGMTYGDEIDVPMGTPFSLSAVENPEWTFMGWSTDGVTPTIMDNPYEGTVTGDMHYTAHFEYTPMLYSVTAVPIPPEGGSTSGDQTDVTAGTPFSLLATPEMNWDFIGWSTDGSTIFSMMNPLEGTVTETVEYQAHFEYNPPLFSVTAIPVPPEGGVTSGDVIDVEAGTPYSLTASPYPNWEFLGWGIEDADPTIMDNPLTGTVASTTYFTAHFAYNPPPPDRYSVTTMAMPPEGGTTTGDVVNVLMGTPYTLTATANPDWIFVGWGIESEPPTIMDNPLVGTVASTTYFTAHFEYNPPPQMYSVTTIADPPEGGTTTGDVVSVPMGTPYTLYAEANPGWNFIGWGVEDGDPTMMDNPLVGTVATTTYFTAYFSQEPPVYYDLYITISGSGTTSPEPYVYHEYIEGAQATLHADPIGPGWYFSSWTGTDGSAVYYDSDIYHWAIDMTSDRFITATFGYEGGEPSTGALVVYIEGNGSTTPSEGYHEYDTTSGPVVIDVSADADSGWYFHHWEGAVDDGEVTVDPYETEEITAVFRKRSTPPPRRYTLDISVEGSGDVDPFIGSRSYTYGTMVDVAADPADGWTFLGWFGDDGGDVLDGEIRMDANKSIIAVFQEEPPLAVDYFLTVDVQGEGSVAPSRGSHKYAENATAFVAATPAEGWTFVGWFGTNGGEIVDGELLMNGNKSITAVFEPKELPLTGSALPLMNWTIGLVVMSIGAFFRKEKQ